MPLRDAAVIVIGRNEGARLVRCLASVQGFGRVVYVDSGSTDDSVAAAHAAGAQVVALDMDRPFTAARARNAGFEALRAGGCRNSCSSSTAIARWTPAGPPPPSPP